MMDHASLFTKTVHRYLPKLYILIYRSCTLLFTEVVHYYLPIMVHCYLPITKAPHIRFAVGVYKPLHGAVIKSYGTER